MARFTWRLIEGAALPPWLVVGLGMTLGWLVMSILLSGCVGVVDDYTKTALAFGEGASMNSIENLRAKHDLEASAYAAAYCGQPRIGAVERRYADPAVMMQRLAMCEVEREIGYGR